MEHLEGSDFAASSRGRFWREILSLVPWTLAVSGCSPVEAEVGSGLPTTPNLDASEGGAVSRCGPSPIRLYYWNTRPLESTTLIDYVIKVENATGAPLPVSSLKIRYYLTNELMAPGTIDIFYTDTCCSNKIVGFNGEILTGLKTIPATPNADAYLEIAFTAAAVGSLAAGDAVQVELGFHDPAYARSLTQTNDYSYGPTAVGTQAQWNDCPGAQCAATFTTCSITVDQNDVLVWGTPP